MIPKGLPRTRSGVGTGFPPARSPGTVRHFGLMLRRAKAGRKRSCSNKKLERDDDSKKSHLAVGGKPGQDCSSILIICLYRQPSFSLEIIRTHRHICKRLK